MPPSIAFLRASESSLATLPSLRPAPSRLPPRAISLSPEKLILYQPALSTRWWDRKGHVRDNSLFVPQGVTGRTGTHPFKGVRLSPCPGSKSSLRNPSIFVVGLDMVSIDKKLVCSAERLFSRLRFVAVGNAGLVA